MQEAPRNDILQNPLCKGICCPMNNSIIGARIKALREGKKLTQERLAEILQVESRQSVSEIERGRRRLSAEELIKVVRYFDVTFDQLTNPFLLSAKDSFSWRQKNVALQDLNSFENVAGEWVGAYRELARLNNIKTKKILPRIGLTHASSFEEAVQAGEDVAEEMGLTNNPAHHLINSLEEKFDILVLMVDPIEGISGAACRLQALNAILINKNEQLGRRNSDVAHEFFHILTWDQMKPERVECSAEAWERPSSRSQNRNLRIEQLADNFASGLLMPSWELDRIGPPSKTDPIGWLVAAAIQLGVSVNGLKWRLVNSKRYPELIKIKNDDIALVAQNIETEKKPELFGGRFINIIIKSIEGGHLSAGRAARLLGVSRSGLADLCKAYGFPCPVELQTGVD